MKMIFLVAILYGVLKLFEYAVENALYKAMVEMFYWIGMMFGPFSFVDQLSKLGMSYLTGECEFNYF